MYYKNTVTGAIFLIRQYELIFRYHFLFCVLLNRNTSYRSFSGFLTSLRISKVKGEAHHGRFILLRHREAEQEIRSHSAVIRVFIVSFASWTICV